MKSEMGHCIKIVASYRQQTYKFAKLITDSEIYRVKS